MQRYISMIGVLMLLGVAQQVHAEEGAVYAVRANARRTAEGQTIVSVKITATRPSGAVDEIATPMLIVADGQQANMRVGSAAASNPSDGMENGVQIDLIKIKGEDRVLLVSKVLEKGLVVWAHADTVSVGASGGEISVSSGTQAGGGGVGRSAGGGEFSSGGSGFGFARPAGEARRVAIDYKYRVSAGNGEWHEGTTRMLTGTPAPLNLWEINASVYELTTWENGSAGIKGINGRVVRTKAEDFDAKRVSATDQQFKSAGQVPLPIAAGDVFAVRYGEASEALIRIRSIESAASQPASLGSGASGRSASVGSK